MIVLSANRIVVFGDEMYDAVVPDSAQAFDFQSAYDLSDATVRLFDISHGGFRLRSVRKLSYNEVHKLISSPCWSSKRFMTCFLSD